MTHSDAALPLAKRPPRRWIRQALLAAVLLDVLIVAAFAGLSLRAWVWRQTATIRYSGDISNGYYWGGRAADIGVARLINTLDQNAQGIDEPEYGLDYTPLRLAVMRRWVIWTRQHFPQERRWNSSYAFNLPLLRLNTACAAAAALLAAALAWVVMRRAAGGRRAIFAALTAGLLVWFNPAVLVNAHAWPQWDCWLLPFYFGAALASVLGGWFFAGILLAIGAMLKGQMVMTAGIFVLWPLFMGQWRAVLWLLCGAILGTGACLWPWLAPLIHWPAVLLTLWLAGLFFLARRPRRWRLAQALIISGFVLLCGLGINPSWYRIGFEYGTRKYPTMNKRHASNIATLLSERFNWRRDDVLMTVGAKTDGILAHRPIELTIRQTLVGLYGLSLVMCAAAAARFAKRGDRRLLVALSVPWVMLFVLLPQMHQRYLLWGAAISGVAAVVGSGPLLLHLLTSAAAAAMMLHTLVDRRRGWENLNRILDGTHPDMAWLLALLALLWLYQLAGRRPGDNHEREKLQ